MDRYGWNLYLFLSRIHGNTCTRYEGTMREFLFSFFCSIPVCELKLKTLSLRATLFVGILFFNAFSFISQFDLPLSIDYSTKVDLKNNSVWKMIERKQWTMRIEWKLVFNTIQLNVELRNFEIELLWVPLSYQVQS